MEVDLQLKVYFGEILQKLEEQGFEKLSLLEHAILLLNQDSLPDPNVIELIKAKVVEVYGSKQASPQRPKPTIKLPKSPRNRPDTTPKAQTDRIHRPKTADVQPKAKDDAATRREELKKKQLEEKRQQDELRKKAAEERKRKMDEQRNKSLQDKKLKAEEDQKAKVSRQEELRNKALQDKKLKAEEDQKIKINRQDEQRKSALQKKAEENKAGKIENRKVEEAKKRGKKMPLQKPQSMVCGVLKIKITEAKKLGPGAKKLGVRIGSEQFVTPEFTESDKTLNFECVFNITHRQTPESQNPEILLSLAKKIRAKGQLCDWEKATLQTMKGKVDLLSAQKTNQGTIFVTYQFEEKEVNLNQSEIGYIEIEIVSKHNIEQDTIQFSNGNDIGKWENEICRIGPVNKAKLSEFLGFALMDWHESIIDKGYYEIEDGIQEEWSDETLLKWNDEQNAGIRLRWQKLNNEEQKLHDAATLIQSRWKAKIARIWFLSTGKILGRKVVLYEGLYYLITIVDAKDNYFIKVNLQDSHTPLSKTLSTSKVPKMEVEQIWRRLKINPNQKAVLDETSIVEGNLQFYIECRNLEDLVLKFNMNNYYQEFAVDHELMLSFKHVIFEKIPSNLKIQILDVYKQTTEEYSVNWFTCFAEQGKWQKIATINYQGYPIQIQGVFDEFSMEKKAVALIEKNYLKYKLRQNLAMAQNQVQLLARKIIKEADKFYFLNAIKQGDKTEVFITGSQGKMWEKVDSIQLDNFSGNFDKITVSEGKILVNQMELDQLVKQLLEFCQLGARGMVGVKQTVRKLLTLDAFNQVFDVRTLQRRPVSMDKAKAICIGLVLYRRILLNQQSLFVISKRKQHSLIEILDKVVKRDTLKCIQQFNLNKILQKAMQINTQSLKRQFEKVKHKIKLIQRSFNNSRDSIESQGSNSSFRMYKQVTRTIKRKKVRSSSNSRPNNIPLYRRSSLEIHNTSNESISSPDRSSISICNIFKPIYKLEKIVTTNKFRN